MNAPTPKLARDDVSDQQCSRCGGRTTPEQESFKVGKRYERRYAGTTCAHCNTRMRVVAVEHVEPFGRVRTVSFETIKRSYLAALQEGD